MPITRASALTLPAKCRAREGGRLSSVGLKPGVPVQSQTAFEQATPGWKRPLLLALVLVAATAALYLRVDHYDFVNYDDTIYVTQNSHVQQGLTWDTLRWAFTTYRVGTWHPLTWLSHALDWQLFDLDASGPHDVNVLLHLANAMLLFWILLRATGFSGRSFMVAALFALHPINVESVVWIAERKNSLSLLFFLLGLAAYRWYVERPGSQRYLAVVLLFAFGLMSKPQVITFPFVLLLWDYWPLRRITFHHGDGFASPKFWRLVGEKLPLFAMSGVSAAITMAAQRADGNKMWYPLSLRVEYAVVSYVQYLGKALWPVNLAAFYPHPDSVSLAHAAACALLLAAITLAVLALHHGRPYLTTGWFFFLGTLVPMLGLEGIGYQGKQGIADRYAYLPFIGLFLMICWGLAELAARQRIPLVQQRLAGVAILLALWLVSYRQLGYWRDNVTLWSHALAVTQGNFLAENNLGRALIQQGRSAEGIAHFYKAAEIYPDDPVSNFNLGLYEQQRGNYPAAVVRFRKTLSVTRDPELRATALKNLATASSLATTAPRQ